MKSGFKEKDCGLSMFTDDATDNNAENCNMECQVQILEKTKEETISLSLRAVK